jgi:putative tryptophan/tyrosine transport system substrate-binding protein
MIQRRILVVALGASLTGQAALLRAQTSSGSLRRVGVLAPSTRAKEEITLKPFFDQMRELGWIEGQNIAYDRVYADDHQQMLPKLAAEMVARKPELIYAPPTPAAVAAKQATQTIPIVFGAVTDPVGHRAGDEPRAPGRHWSRLESTRFPRGNRPLPSICVRG